MKINTYRTELNTAKVTTLVQEKEVSYEDTSFSSPDDYAHMMNDLYNMRYMAEEYVFLVATDTKQHILGVFEISHGTVNSSVLSPREVLVRALLIGATNVVLLHNHPSGDVAPSKDDIKITERVNAACDIVGVKLLDHIIIGGNNFFSFKTENYI